MKPTEFIARVVSLFDFDLGESIVNLKARSMHDAHLFIRQSGEEISKKIDGYTFVLEAKSVLGNQIVRAGMSPPEIPRPIGQSKLGIRASVCFTLQDYEFLQGADPDNIYERYQLPLKYKHDETEMIDMLVYLKLKTSI